MQISFFRQVFHDGLKNKIETRHSVSLCLLFCPVGIVTHVITKVITQMAKRSHWSMNPWIYRLCSNLVILFFLKFRLFWLFRSLWCIVFVHFLQFNKSSQFIFDTMNFNSIIQMNAHLTQPLNLFVIFMTRYFCNFTRLIKFGGNVQLFQWFSHLTINGILCLISCLIALILEVNIFLSLIIYYWFHS